MPQPGQRSLSIKESIHSKMKEKYEIEKTGNQTFVQWVGDYFLINFEKDEFISKYAPYLSKIGITDNILFIRDSKKNIVVEIRMKNGVLVSSHDDPIYLQFAWSLPELSRLNL